ncbi:beta-sandwich lipoprotein [Nocardia sp. NPDC055002]
MRDAQQAGRDHRVGDQLVAVAALFAGAIAVTGCSSDADVVSKNLSKESDQFKINRRVVFFNGITDKYLLSIEGKCSIKDENNQLEVTCKTGDEEYKKHFLGLSDNVSYFVEQLEAAEVSPYHYKVIFKPEVIIPDVDRP